MAEKENVLAHYSTACNKPGCQPLEPLPAASESPHRSWSQEPARESNLSTVLWMQPFEPVSQLPGPIPTPELYFKSINKLVKSQLLFSFFPKEWSPPDNDGMISLLGERNKGMRVEAYATMVLQAVHRNEHP